MSPAVTLSAQETVERILPLLKEYANKLDHVAVALTRLETYLTAPYSGGREREYGPTAAAIEVVRMMCLFDTLQKPVADLASHASGFLEGTDVDHTIWTELKLRLDELEEHLRFTKALVERLKPILKNHHDEKSVRALVEKTRPKAPF